MFHGWAPNVDANVKSKIVGRPIKEWVGVGRPIKEWVGLWTKLFTCVFK